ncbi:MAG: FKBP-type peptidyl-prolyl cis-trans isomerase [Nocardioidaceae bacterium]|nr:FKBP-type peptidyl-prolyl cis-trans isomerase [Nocardioidaceae bacterium]
MTRRLLAALLAVLLVTGCSGSVGKDGIRSAEGSITGLTVAGEVGVAPVVRMAPPLRVDETRSETVVAGTGAPVVVDQLFVLQLTMYDARTGAKAISTYDPGQTAMAVKNTSGTLFPALADALVGQRQGSRLVMTLTSEDGYGDSGAPQYGIEAGDALVLVADVVSVPPTEVLPSVTGATRALAGLPRVVLEAGVPRGLDFTGARRPAGLVVRTLIAGDGPPVRDDSLVTLRSLGQVWGSRDPFDDTFAKEPILVPVGVGQVVAAWDRALTGVRRGSRLLVVAPPRLAFEHAGRPPLIPPDATIGYVIDVLGVS